MDQELQRYLNDHLAGSAGAIGLIQKLATTAEDPAEAAFFHSLERKVEADRALLKDLIALLGQSSSSVLETAGSITGAASRLKLGWEGMEPGQLGRFEAMELLALGIQGKRLLWLMLAELAPCVPEWEGKNFTELELEAINQRDSVEELRIVAGRDALLHRDRHQHPR
ncbi:hypothetical protein OJ996_05230 [Luteolibacter sp. GHJ8]|uniref:Ferritin-like metal-binding protein YciE n=1 Tax=Luteolibacter rhizosphaerae TaxID=2989719 RepID=A0ABT3FZW8_9BACT|nr:hypothetical protein [Luteolibacter rhizosphaerae]MCW1912962.1 hypothetical protein [Luteolibacter rhizosphaerae]